MRHYITLFFILFTVAVHGQKMRVKRVIDGDTYVIETGEKVRMIGIDAPEMKTDFGDDAKEYLEHLIEGKYIVLKDDPKNQDKDRYGRLLRYAELNGEDINQRMVCSGYAIAYLRYPFKKKEAYKRCQERAEDNKAGMWALSHPEKLYKKEKKRTKKEKTSTPPAAGTNPNPSLNQYPDWIVYIMFIILAAVVALKVVRRYLR